MISIFRVLTSACLLFLCPIGGHCHPADRFDIIIDELLPDPSPAIGLPNYEFIELKNNSASPFSLKGWRLSDGSSTAIINNDIILQSGACIIVCPNAAVAEYSRYGNAIGVAGFPSLNNDHDLITLYSPEGKIIHAVEYFADWYQNDIKRDGGWSLEMIDTENPCSGHSNWIASTDPSGGTPGRINAVHDINPDEMPPALLRTYTIDSTTIVAVFDEPLDSNSAAVLSNYQLDVIGPPISALPQPPLFKEVLLQLPVALAANKVYQLSTSYIRDCAGNAIGIMNKAPAGRPAMPGYFDVVINEILFNPPPAGYDYIELYNRSEKVIDLQQLYVCNRNAAGNFTNIKQLADRPLLFFPGMYCVICENIGWPRSHYPLKGEPIYCQLSSLPSMPDDKEHIAIAHIQGQVIDQLAYDEHWHFALVDNDEGVALERISYNDSTQNKNNWTSAASSAGYGTPGYANSQWRADQSPQGMVSISPKIFSIDNTRFTTISCRFTEPGYVVNISVYDDNGRIVRRLISNTTAAISANFNWDGLDERQRQLPVGNYIILTEVFNLQGMTKKFKNVVTLAARL